jgi:hypothetical protein
MTISRLYPVALTYEQWRTVLACILPFHERTDAPPRTVSDDERKRMVESIIPFLRP